MLGWLFEQAWTSENLEHLFLQVKSQGLIQAISQRELPCWAAYDSTPNSHGLSPSTHCSCISDKSHPHVTNTCSLPRLLHSPYPKGNFIILSFFNYTRFQVFGPTVYVSCGLRSSRQHFAQPPDKYWLDGEWWKWTPWLGKNGKSLEHPKIPSNFDTRHEALWILYRALTWERQFLNQLVSSCYQIEI